VSSELAILLIDDDDDDLVITRGLLAKAGSPHRLDRVATFEEGVAAVTRGAHDIYLVDYRLGARTGIDLIRESMERGASGPFVVLTGQGDLTADREATFVGAAGYLEKAGLTPLVLERTIRNALERSRIMKELRASEARARAVFEGSLDGIVVSDDDASIRDVNPAACMLLGRPREVLVGMGEDALYPPEERDAARERRRALREKGLLRAEVCMARADGTRREVELVARANYVPGLHMIVLRDITGRKQLEEQLRQSQRLEAVGRLAGGVAHDYNNILTAIVGYSEIILGAMPKNDPLARPAAEILKAGNRATALTKQLLALSRRQVLQARVVNLNTIVAEIEEMLRRLIGEHVVLTTRLAEDLGNVSADPAQLDQILTNLVVNARDAVPGGGTVLIETANAESVPDDVRARVDLQADVGAPRRGAPPDSYVMISVTDNGHGVDARTRSHLFEPFFTTKAAEKGTGLGLASVYGSVTQSGGYIGVRSELGRGTTFTIYLPRVDAAADESRTTKATPRSKQGSGVILIAEDEDLVRGFVRTTLEGLGYTTLEARDGREALTLLENHTGRIDLLLTDVIMPRMGGPELARGALALRPDLRVLFMSGYTKDPGFPARELGAGASFIQKPFELQAFAAKINEVLGLDVGVKESQPGSSAPGSAGALAETRRVFVRLALLGQRSEATKVVLGALREGASVLDVYTSVFQPALFELGQRWERNEINVAQEHMATAITMHLMNRLADLLERSSVRRGRAVITGVDGDGHGIGARMVADLLEADGWDVRFLGAGVPAPDVVSQLRTEKPDVLGISATLSSSLPSVGALVKAVSAEFGERRPRVILGGQAFRLAPDFAHELGVELFGGGDLRAAVAMLRAVPGGG
jgi:two-component system cell cycle sensor histidine kinase/response regulator CckA